VCFSKFLSYPLEKSVGNLRQCITYRFDGEPYFDIPEGHQDRGRKILAYYWWLFPNMMFNIYTWGISLNIVKPLGNGQTEIVFKTYLLPDVEKDMRISEALDQTEMEDEAVRISTIQMNHPTEEVVKKIREYLNQAGKPAIPEILITGYADKKTLEEANDLTSITWKDLQNLVGDKWLPGLNTPFDPFAVKIGLKLRKKLALYIGRKEAFFSKIKGEEFKGTIVEG